MRAYVNDVHVKITFAETALIITAAYNTCAPIERSILAVMRVGDRGAALAAACRGGASGQWRRLIAGSLLVTAGPRTVAVVESESWTARQTKGEERGDRERTPRGELEQRAFRGGWYKNGRAGVPAQCDALDSQRHEAPPLSSPPPPSFLDPCANPCVDLDSCARASAYVSRVCFRRSRWVR